MGNCHVSGGVHVMYTAERFDPRVALAMAAETGTHVLSVIGDASGPIFREIHTLIQQWLPQAKALEVPQATHGLQMWNAAAVADGLARFFADPVS